jgi:hypothetical protein
MPLSDEEREHIRLVEEYRAAVQAKLAAPAAKGESLLDKLAVPLLIVIVSGLLVPWILGRVEENRRALDLQSRLIEQIVADDAAAQVNLLQYRGVIGDYRLNLLDLELEKCLLANGTAGEEEKQAQRDELQDEIEREHARRDQVFSATSAGLSKYLVERDGNVEWVRLHYGEAPELKTYSATVKKEHQKAARQVAAYNLETGGAYKTAAANLRNCKEKEKCKQIRDDAAAAMEKHREQPLDFSAWNEARQKLVQFISETKPRV